MFLDAFHEGAAQRADTELAARLQALNDRIERHRPSTPTAEEGCALPWSNVPDPHDNAVDSTMGTLYVQPLLSFPEHNNSAVYLYGRKPSGKEGLIGSVHFFSKINEIDRPEPLLRIQLGPNEIDTSWQSANAPLFLQPLESAISE